jgi:pyruvate formate lyase activating enzyme
MCGWIKSNLGDSVPVHFSRFHPEHKLTNLPVTPIKTMEQAYQIACDCGLKFVYLGNVSPHPAESTYCPSCRKILIKRMGYIIEENIIKNNSTNPDGFSEREPGTGKCPYCATVIPGVWDIK